MSVFSRIFPKKKKEFTALCALSNEPIERGYGYLLTTAEVISSRKFWDTKMTEPEMLSYSINHFTKQDPSAVQIRSLMFDKFSTREEPWLISDTFISWFEVDKEKARNCANKYWESEGNYAPECSGGAVSILEKQSYQELKDYAIMEAGREYVQRKVAV